MPEPLGGAQERDPVARVELYHYSSPLPATFHPSWIPGFPQNENRCTLIRVITESGVEGWSAGPSIGKERAGLGQLIGPYLIGEDATDIALVQQRLREIGYLGWRNWWIEPAFWDIKGHIAGKPVCELLGGSPVEVGVYASAGEVRSPTARIEEAEARLAEGFRTLKIRVHEDEASDLLQVKEVCAAVGDRMSIGVDANQAWRVTAISDAPLWDLERAKRFADACAESGVAWIEEPLPMDAYDDLAALTEYSSVPIAGGELHTSGYPELKMMIDRRCYAIFQPDAMFTGGIAQTWKLIEACRAAGLTYTPHTWTNGVGFGVNLQLMAASGFQEGIGPGAEGAGDTTPGGADAKGTGPGAEGAGDTTPGGAVELEYPYDPPGWVPEARDSMLERPFVHSKGRLRTPSEPGLGITIDRSALRKHGRRFFAMNRRRLAFFALRDRGLKAAKEMDKAKRARLRDAP